MTMGDGSIIPIDNSTSDMYYIYVNNKEFSVTKGAWMKLEKGQTIKYNIGWTGIENIVIVEEIESYYN